MIKYAKQNEDSQISIIPDGNIPAGWIEVTEEDYKAQKAQEEQEERAKQFFNTSLGYVKRKVTMATGDVRDFLFDIKPTLQVGVPIITYNLDGTQNRGVVVTEEFLAECDRQVYIDFYGEEPVEENTNDTTIL